MQTSVMLCAPLDTPVCGISRGEATLSNVDLSVLRGLGRNRVTVDDQPSHEREGLVCTGLADRMAERE